MRSYEIIYSKASKKFLDRNRNIISESKTDELVIKSVKKIFYKQDINIDIVRMVNYKPIHYRIRYRNIRIIISVKDDKITIVDVKNIDFRGDIYK